MKKKNKGRWPSKIVFDKHENIGHNVIKYVDKKYDL